MSLCSDDPPASSKRGTVAEKSVDGGNASLSLGCHCTYCPVSYIGVGRCCQNIKNVQIETETEGIMTFTT